MERRRAAPDDDDDEDAWRKASATAAAAASPRQPHPSENIANAAGKSSTLGVPVVEPSPSSSSPSSSSPSSRKKRRLSNGSDVRAAGGCKGNGDCDREGDGVGSTNVSGQDDVDGVADADDADDSANAAVAEDDDVALPPPPPPVIKPIAESSVRRMVAGQAVTDLASATKELIDNAIDADASEIKIRLVNRGLDAVEVSDDGTGVPMSSRGYLATRHATSKIRTFKELYDDGFDGGGGGNDGGGGSGSGGIEGGGGSEPRHDRHADCAPTLGFRGEALFCLANLSRSLVVSTRTVDERAGQKMEFDRSGALMPSTVRPIARRVGTTVAVVGLFDALPVRRADFTKRIGAQRTKLIKMLQGYAILCLQSKFQLVDSLGSKTEVKLSAGGRRGRSGGHMRGGSHSNGDGKGTGDGSESDGAVDAVASALEERTACVLGTKFLSGLTRIEVDLTSTVGDPSYGSSFDGDDGRNSNADEATIDATAAENTGSEDARGVRRRSRKKWKMEGLISLPPGAPCPNGAVARDLQFFSINGRPVDLPSVSRIISDVWRRYDPSSADYGNKGEGGGGKSGGKGSSGGGGSGRNKRPACVLAFTLPRSAYDVNLSPDKREVLFSNEASAADVIRTGLEKFWSRTEGTFETNLVEGKANKKTNSGSGRTSAEKKNTEGIDDNGNGDDGNVKEHHEVEVGSRQNEGSPPDDGVGGDGGRRPSRLKMKRRNAQTAMTMFSTTDVEEHHEAEGGSRRDEGSPPDDGVGVDGGLRPSRFKMKRRNAQTAMTMFSMTDVVASATAVAEEEKEGAVVTPTVGNETAVAKVVIARLTPCSAAEVEEEGAPSDGGGEREGPAPLREDSPSYKENVSIGGRGARFPVTREEDVSADRGSAVVGTTPPSLPLPSAVREQEADDRKVAREKRQWEHMRLRFNHAEVDPQRVEIERSVASPPPASNDDETDERTLGGEVEDEPARRGSFRTDENVSPPEAMAVAASDGTKPRRGRRRSKRPKHDDRNEVSSFLQSFAYGSNSVKSLPPAAAAAAEEEEGADESDDEPIVVDPVRTSFREGSVRRISGTSKGGSRGRMIVGPRVERKTPSTEGDTSLRAKRKRGDRNHDRTSPNDAPMAGISDAGASQEEADADQSTSVEADTKQEPTATSVVWDLFSKTSDIVKQSQRARLKMRCNRKRLHATLSDGTVVESIDDGSVFSHEEKEAPSLSRETSTKLNLSKEDFLHMSIVGQFNLGFILARCRNNNLWILDQHACDEIYNFERLLKETNIHEQKLIAPLPLELSPSEENCIVENMEVFEKNGFRFSYDSEKLPRHRLSLTALPHSGSGKKSVQFGKEDVGALCAMLGAAGTSYGADFSTGTDRSGSLGNNAVRRYAGQEDSGVSLTQSSKAGGVIGSSIVRLPKAVAMFASRACRGSIMIGTALSHEKMLSFVQKLHKTDSPWTCPHGRPTMNHVCGLIKILAGDEDVAAEHVAGPSLSILSQNHEEV